MCVPHKPKGEDQIIPVSDVTVKKVVFLMPGIIYKLTAAPRSLLLSVTAAAEVPGHLMVRYYHRA